MSDLLGNTPANTVNNTDPGDETARRYRYQWTYAAVVCCMLLDETEDAAEEFCEQHEDILIAHSDSTFTGLQVKTKSSDQPPWKTTDEGVMNSCTRYAALESAFPGMFRSYRFLTNHPLYQASSRPSLSYILQQVRETPDVETLHSPVKRFVEIIAERAGCAADTVFHALSKTQASHDLPKLLDITIRLLNTIAQTCKVRVSAHLNG